MPKFSQVFLDDKAICARIAGALAGGDFDRLIEIGPGGGALTGFLFPEYGGRMKAVEIDKTLAPALTAKFKGLEVINKDFLQLDLAAAAGPGRTAFIGNLPYDCATPILEKVLSFGGFALAVFMFQKEVARRITALPGDHDYGFLTLITAARAQAELLMDIKAASFKPVPAVDSSVLLLRPKKYFSATEEEAAFTGLLKKAFMHRRKTLVNSLALAGLDKAAAAAAVARAGLKPSVRPQELSLSVFAQLAELLEDK
ncbi:MAG TPA: 16S rRNA (adenine(1518)-N(6)/adenine(1519)-N(6))-dimethyltransferase RsmA [Elusimicrobiales bacterium]|nr:16S rRNA (adenine(1518)-N(6)/adenine(1519)-N(6))-dimethyltransferase RsmA [Elusimicrobiales bacterium]